MRVWLTKLGEPVPTDGPVRLHRCGILSPILSSLGHDVVWWTSTFSHINKTQRFDDDFTYQVDPAYQIEFLYAPGYARNVSLQRIRHHQLVARKFASAIANQPPPDVILCSYPTAEMLEVALQYAAPRSIPVIVDVRDHWPDKFLDLIPSPLKGLGRFALWPMFKKNRDLFRQAKAIIGVSRTQLKWGLVNAGRQRRPEDAVFPYGYPDLQFSAEEREMGRQIWLGRGVTRDRFVCCYFGAISLQFDLEVIIEAARRLHGQKIADVLFVLCGTGSRLDYYRGLARDLPNVLFPGWVDALQIATLMDISHVGLAPYLPDDSMAVPNKVGEYLSGGLPILSSIEGELGALLCTHRCGMTYQSGNVEDFLRVVRQVYENPPLRKTMSTNARRLYEEQFSADKVYTQLAAYLVSISEGTPDNAS